MRYLAIDMGERRTGLATGDDETGVVVPARVLEVAAGPALLEALDAAVTEHGPDALVVGLPLNMDGTEGAAAKRAREAGEALARRSSLPVHYQDERLTSFDADQEMAGSGRTHAQKRKLRDALAACAILRDFLRQRD